MIRPTVHQMNYMKEARAKIKENKGYINDRKDEIDRIEVTIEKYRLANMNMQFNIDQIEKFGDKFSF